MQPLNDDDMEEHDQLTNIEHESIRMYVRRFMAEHPPRAPFHIRALDWGEAAFLGSHTSGTFAYARFAGAAFAVVLFVGFGTSYAAQSALPGQALYGVKVNVNEKVAGALAITPVSRAQFSAQLTERRLEEAEMLAAANELSPEISVEIQSRIEETTSSFNSHVADLAEWGDGTVAAADAQSDMEAKLTAHANVLVALTTTVPDTKDALAPIISAVETHVATARDARSSVTASLTTRASEGGAPVRAAADRKKESAKEALERVRMLASEREAGASASSSAAIAERASEVEEAVQQGEAYLQTGEYERADEAFQGAIRAATQTETEAAISLELKKILPAFPLEATTTIGVEVNVGVSVGGVLGTTTSRGGEDEKKMH